uniref:U6 snRNA phosphodiesterase n=1 Tax=Lygus hesperus TaxID=30085 RepID=A0A0K8T016_LYGHE
MSNGLKLLSGYGSEEEDAEEKQRLPLPDSLKENFPPPFEDEVIDDPEQHDGRSRRYPHQRGNWNSIVYIPYQRDVPFDLLCDQIIDHCNPTVALKKIQEPHVSLTRTFVLLYHWIDSFVSSVKGSLQTFSRFDLQFDGLKVYCNEDNSRTFLALTVGFGKMEIYKTVQLLDKVLGEYKLHPFYDEASFHMSIVWALGNKKTELESMIPELNKIFDASLNDNLDLTIPITNYICKIGHKIYNLKLL